MSDATLATSAATRLSQADRAVDDRPVGTATTDGLFAVADLLSGNVALRRALTDPAHSAEQRQGLVHGLLDGKVDPLAVDVVADIVALRWTLGSELTAAVERQGVRSELRAALAAGTLDQVEDELFRFDRLVAGDAELRNVVEDRTVDVDARRRLVASLLDGRSDQATSRLAQRAVGSRSRTFATTIESYLQLSALLRQRMIARVTVAKPLTEGQTNRLKAALSKQQGRDVELQVTVDPAVLGGVRVELGDDVIDGTVSHRLAEVSRDLA